MCVYSCAWKILSSYSNTFQRGYPAVFDILFLYFYISAEIISLSQRKTKMKVFMVLLSLFKIRIYWLHFRKHLSSTSKKSTLYNGDNGTAIMNLIFQMEKTSVILLRKKQFASNNPCLYNNFVNNIQLSFFAISMKRSFPLCAFIR